MSNAVSVGGALQSLKIYKLQRCFSLCDDVLEVAINALEEVEKLHVIGTVSEFRELKEKATAKAVNQERGFDKCPNCGEVLNDDSGERYKFCPDCGQRLLWD